jgi:hypothetical protein
MMVRLAPYWPDPDACCEAMEKVFAFLALFLRHCSHPARRGWPGSMPAQR